MGRVLWLLSFVAVLGCAAGAARAQDRPLVHEVTVPLDDGRVDVADLVRALLASYDLDADAVTIPSKRVDLRGVKGQLLLLGCRKLLLDTVRFRRSLDDDLLTVVVDRERAREVRRDLRARVAKLVGRLTGEDLLERRYELALPDPLDPARPLLVLVHGVESSPDAWSDLRGFLEPKGAQVATFGYPNDGACDRAAAELSKALRALGDQRVALVGFSMGGLVARATLEDPALDPGNVDRLVLIGTPNRGSNLAGLRFALEAAHLLRRPGGTEGFGRALLEGMRANMVDGLGEAGGDLLPGSVFLTRLAARQRNPRVTYHLVLGTRSVLTAPQLDLVRARAHELLGHERALRVARPRIEAWLGDLRELVDGEGDGAVAVARGRLDGVEPLLVPLDHVGLIRLRGLLLRVEDPAAHPVFAAVAAWVGV